MEEPKVIEYRVLKEGENLICLVKMKPEGGQVLHIPGDPDYDSLIDFDTYLDLHYGD